MNCVLHRVVFRFCDHDVYSQSGSCYCFRSHGRVVIACSPLKMASLFNKPDKGLVQKHYRLMCVCFQLVPLLHIRLIKQTCKVFFQPHLLSSAEPPDLITTTSNLIKMSLNAFICQHADYQIKSVVIVVCFFPSRNENTQICCVKSSQWNTAPIFLQRVLKTITSMFSLCTVWIL